MNNISLTIPMDYDALTRASDMLNGLAIDLKHKDGGRETRVKAPSVGASTTAVDNQHVTEPAEPVATEVFAQQPEAAPATAAPEVVNLAPATTNPEIDIPWDSRIHSGSKAKLAKPPHGWKMRRGVDEGEVRKVEAELIAAMAASPANPVIPNGPAQSAAPAIGTEVSEKLYACGMDQETVTAAVASAQSAAPAGTITTFPQLIAKITASGINQATVTAAVNKQGLQALPLLAARPDLIPAVAAELFPGG